MQNVVRIFSFQDLTAALAGQPGVLELQTSLLCPYSLILPDGFSLKGFNKDRCILSFNNSDGIGLTANNTIQNLIIQTNPSNRAIYLLSDRPDLGTLNLNNLTITGQVQILIRTGTDKINLIADQVDVAVCDSRRYSEQPQKYGVNVYQGAFTVYNFNGDSKSVIHVHLANITIGRKGAPVIGSGLFISGYGDNGGWVIAESIVTGDIYSNGMIPYGTANMITAGVFIVYGVKVKNLVNYGSVTTYGVNDMVLDAWGEVDNWVVEKPITSYGPSGIGFVNFGQVGHFEALDKIETFGLGARGFNQYDGTISKAIFHSIITHGNGSIGIQVSRAVGSIEVKNGIITHGTVGQTLVKGVIMSLPADGISVKPGGAIQKLIVSGGITTDGNQVHSYHVEGGVVESLEISGEVAALGEDSVAISVTDKGQTPLDNISAVSKQGIAVKLYHARVDSSEGLHAVGAKGDVVETEPEIHQ